MGEMRVRVISLSACAWLLACGGAGAPDAALGPDAAVLADAAFVPDATSAPDATSDADADAASAPDATSAPDAGALDWSPLDDALARAQAGGIVHGYALQVFGADDTLLHQVESGVCASTLGGERNGACPMGDQPFTVDLVTGIASSSKWVASTLALAALETAVARGDHPDLVTALDAPLSGVLTCPALPPGADVARISLRQLLSFTDGLLPNHDCVGALSTDLASCACTILADSQAARLATCTRTSPRTAACPAGTVYRYGETHHAVVGAVVENILGQRWADALAAEITGPLGVTMGYLNPRNPNIAGGLRTSVADYATFVASLARAARGERGGVISPEAFALQEAVQASGDDVLLLLSPQPGFDYGLNVWRWCYAPITAADVEQPSALRPDRSCASGPFALGHGGKGGYNPWIDRRSGAYAVFATREASPGGAADYTEAERALATQVRLWVHLIAGGAR